jgi:hypothetical protein
MSVARKSVLLLATLLLPSAVSLAADRATPSQPAAKPAAAQGAAASAGQNKAKPRPAGYEPGEKWRSTMSMSAMGMTMPPMTTEVCVPKGSQASERMEFEDNCRVTDQKRVGNKQTMRIVCTGRNAMEGDMELEDLGPDRYRGRMKGRSADGEMTMNYEGTRLPGECDAGEMKRKMDELIAAGEKEKLKMCRNDDDRMIVRTPSLFVGPDPMCKDPKDKQRFCTLAQSHKGFGTLSYSERAVRKSRDPKQMLPLSEAAKGCGFGLDAKRDELCNSAAAKGEWVFLANECPKIADPLAQRECAGRDDSNNPVDQKYVVFCNAYGQDRALYGGSGPNGDGEAAGGDAGAAADGATGDQENGAVDHDEKKMSVGDKAKQGLKKLKGLFGR